MIRSPRVLTIIGAVIAVIAFFTISSVAVVWANGLRYNPETKKFEQTVVVAALASKDRQVEIYLNGEIVGSKLPFEKRGLLPNSYNLEVTKAGYHSWNKNFRLSAGEVGILEDIVLIAKEPKTEVLSSMPSFTEPAIEAGLAVTSGGELLDRGKLISRFSGELKVARRFRSGYLYQIGSELRLYFPHGPQDFLLYKLSSDEGAQVTVDPISRFVTLKEADSAKRIVPTLSAASTETEEETY